MIMKYRYIADLSATFPHVMQMYLPVRKDTRTHTIQHKLSYGVYGVPRPELYEWLWEHVGPGNILPETIVEMPSTTRQWHIHQLNEFCTLGFKSKDQAMLFKLTWSE